MSRPAEVEGGTETASNIELAEQPQAGPSQPRADPAAPAPALATSSSTTTTTAATATTSATAHARYPSLTVRRLDPEPHLEVEQDGLNPRDSLRSTREYYGLAPLPTPGYGHGHGIARNASPSHAHAHAHARSASAASGRTRFSTSSRPHSPEAVASAARRPQSPGRVGVAGLVLPKRGGFMSPKKPAAALRLEEELRALAAREQAEQVEAAARRERGQETGLTEEDAEADGDTRPESGKAEVEEGGNARVNGAPEARTSGTATRPSGEDSDRSATNPYTDDLTRRARVRGSIADASSHRETHPAQSSDELFQRPMSGSHSRGASLDVEKAQADNDGRYPPRTRSRSRPSLSQRLSSRRSSVKHPTDHTHTRAQEGRHRRYEYLENPLSTWFCRGRLMTGGDAPWSVLVVLVFLFGITGVWIGTSGVWYWSSGQNYGLPRGAGIAIVIVFVYLFGLTLSSFLASALRDPGVIPRDLDPSPPMTHSDVDSYDGPLDREFAVRRGRVVVRYCETCRSYRPPRGSHCRLCGNCVDGIDHHCSYLHACVGKRTYLAFLTLLVSAGISAIYEVVFSAVHFALVCHTDSIGFGTALARNPGAGVSFILGVVVLPAVLFLLFYHARLVLYNITTVEQIRASSNTAWYRASTRPDNPFAEDSAVGNILRATLGRPMFPSWIGAWKVVKEETRAVNPALVEERWVRTGYLRETR